MKTFFKKYARALYNKGQASMLAMILFFMVSLTIMTGLVNSSTKEIRAVANLGNSAESYFLAEAGMEDAIYRIKNNMPIGTIETITLNGNTAETNVAYIVGGRRVIAEGDKFGFIRRVQAELIAGVGAEFNYGMQSGVGGIEMGNESGIIGNVYSNGNIMGSNGAYITGSAIAASNALISNVDIGTSGVGDAVAYSIRDSTVAGTIYCQSGSANNKGCNTSRSDPQPMEFPITQSDIDAWELDAESGGIIEGDYTVGNTVERGESVATIGPVRVRGNLTVDDRYPVVITGTVKVDGWIFFENNAVVSLDESFGQTGGVILSDSYITVSNGTSISGSGHERSYTLLLTTSLCPDDVYCSRKNAMEIENGSDGVIFNAQNGTINISNGARAKEVVAKKIKLGNNATITYDTGLSNVIFSSGPSGAWHVTDWTEI